MQLKFSSFTTVLTATAAFAMLSGPVFAQHHRRDGGGSDGQAVQRGGNGGGGNRDQGARQAPSEAPRARAEEARRAEAPRQAEAPRRELPRQAEQPRQEAPRRAEAAPQAERRRGDNDGYRGNGGNVYRGNQDNRADGDPRANRDYRRDDRRDDRNNRTYRSWDNGRDRRDGRDYRYQAPRRIYPQRNYRPFYYGSRPYVFRPRSRFSFGLYLGYGVPYSYVYRYPVPVYGYGAPSAPVYITPNSTLYGGITLEITPSDADVFVDGEYAGRVSDFDGLAGPLNLTSGRHRIEVEAPGFEPLAFDVDVYPGQLVPYRGDMYRSRF